MRNHVAQICYTCTTMNEDITSIPKSKHMHKNNEQTRKTQDKNQQALSNKIFEATRPRFTLWPGCVHL
jgi:hypothetical protein